MPVRSRLFHSVVLMGCALVLPACADGSASGDAGDDTSEAGVTDGGPTDAGPTDAGHGNHVTDAGGDDDVDAGDIPNRPLDAGEHDAGWHPTK